MSNGCTLVPLQPSADLDGSKRRAAPASGTSARATTKASLQVSGPPKRNVEKGIAERTPPGLVLATERWMVGIGRGGMTRTSGLARRGERDSRITGRDDHHFVSRTPVRANISARVDGVRVCVSRPALTARPSGEPCDVRITNRTSFSASILLAAACNDAARASIVARPPFFELYCTSTGPAPETARHDACLRQSPRF